MPVDVEKLLSFPIPTVREMLTKQQTAFYALSIGVGQDPMDKEQLAFVDYTGELKVMPSMALILGQPGFWLGGPDSGVDPRSVVHGEEQLTIHSPLPVAGKIIGESRIVGLVDKGPGRGALLYTQKDVREEGSGRLLAETLRTTFLRNGGGFGGDSGPVKESPSQPVGEPTFIVDTGIRPEQALYYRMNGDANPLHSNPAVAKTAGFDRPILHGLCTAGVVCHALVRALLNYDVHRMEGLSIRFSAPTYPGETLRTEIWDDGSFQARVVEREGVIVSRGRACFAS
jgi:acyl dehydratase